MIIFDVLDNDNVIFFSLETSGVKCKIFRKIIGNSYTSNSYELVEKHTSIGSSLFILFQYDSYWIAYDIPRNYGLPFEKNYQFISSSKKNSKV